MKNQDCSPAFYQQALDDNAKVCQGDLSPASDGYVPQHPVDPAVQAMFARRFRWQMLGVKDSNNPDMKNVPRNVPRNDKLVAPPKIY
jgi:hypothetical protein